MPCLRFLGSLWKASPAKLGSLRQCYMPTFPNGSLIFLEYSLNSWVWIRKPFKIWPDSPVFSTFSLPAPHITHRAQTRFLSSLATYLLLFHECSLQAGICLFHSILSHLPFWSPSQPTFTCLTSTYILGLSLHVTSSKKPSLTTQVWFCFLSLEFCISSFTYLAHHVIITSFVSVKTSNTMEAFLVTLVFSSVVSVLGKYQVLYRYLLNKWVRSQYLTAPLCHFVPRFESSNFYAHLQITNCLKPAQIVPFLEKQKTIPSSYWFI